MINPPLWTESPSRFPHEREALSFVRARLPDHEPYRAWSNVEFKADDGSVNEIDLLVVTKSIFALVEIKSFPGVVSGNGQRWQVEFPDGRRRHYDHPVLSANNKARKLRSLLNRQKPFQKQAQVPWISPVVFLSSSELECRLNPAGRTSVTGRDRDDAPGAAPPGAVDLPGIVAALKNPGSASLRGVNIDRPLSARIAAAIEQAGLTPLNLGRKAGDWDLGEVIDEGSGWQDFEGHKPAVEGRRRIRVYLADAAHTEQDVQRLRREAEREVRLLSGLDHQGIANALDIVQADLGPAVIFARTDGEQRLDQWAPEHVRDLSVERRIGLVRQLGEALAFAHQSRVTHRSLNARSVLVRSGTSGDEVQLEIGHWQAGSRELATSMTRAAVTATNLADEYAERLKESEKVYLAPETFIAESPEPIALDVFSFGSLAYLLLTGEEPASDVAGRDARLAQSAGLNIAEAVDGLPEELALMVSVATHPVPAQRDSMRALLGLLDDALRQMNTPESDLDTAVDETAFCDPLSAHKGAMLEGGWKVERRLGAGSTAVAYLVEHVGGGGPEVLKVARSEDHQQVLLDEARVLQSAQHACLVRCHGVTTISGRTVLRLDPAGDPDDAVGMTLADRLQQFGKIGLDLLQRFGDDLLDVLGYLSTEGVTHRDIKPDNLGVRRRHDGSLHLVLFDLSLTKAPDTSLTAGTPGYLDPFLAERPTKRWDESADRYAAAATLHEMATGIRPRWGDGATDPIHLDDEIPVLDPELFDPAVREPLVRFFARALHRQPGKRFDTAGDMRDAWREAFVDAARPTTSLEDTGAEPEDLVALAAVALPDTPITEVGLSGLAVSALQQRQVNTVKELLELSQVDWNRAAGVGAQVRREVTDARMRLAEYVDDGAADTGYGSIDALFGALIPKPTTEQATADQIPLSVLLGVPSQIQIGAPGQLPRWPAWNDVCTATGLSRSEYEAMLKRGRDRWIKQPAITRVRNDIALLLERAGGVLPGAEIVDALLTRRGSMATGAERLTRARAVLRAAIESESARSGNRFIWRRLHDGQAAVVALSSDVHDAEALADYAASLGAEADRLVESDPPPSIDHAIDRLRSVATPVGLTLPEFRLTRLAAAASTNAAVSSRNEIYPRGLSPEAAVRLARAALLGSGTLSEHDVQQRVRTRFPEASPLPSRPELDELLSSVLGLEWIDDAVTPGGMRLPSGFGVRQLSGSQSTRFGMSGDRQQTATPGEILDQDVNDAQMLDERLRRHAGAGGYLVATVAPSLQERAIELLSRYEPDVIDVDRWMITAIKQHATERGIDWERAIMAADAAGPDGERWGRLLGVVRDALAPAWEALLSDHDHVLFTHPGLLSRYDLMGSLDLVRDELRTRASSPRLRTLWVLVAASDPVAPPVVQGRAVPIIGPAEHVVLSDPWLRNVHRVSRGAVS